MLFEKFLQVTRRYFPELLCVTGCIGTYLYFNNGSTTTDRSTLVILITSIIISLIGFSIIMYNYLQSRSGKLSQDTIYESSLQNVITALERVVKRYTDIDSRIDKKFEQLGLILDKTLQKEAIVNFQPAQRDEIYAKISSSISENITSTFFESLKEQLQEKIILEQRIKYDSITHRTREITARLREEIFVLSKRANINLIIGSTLTLSGLSMLGYFVVSQALPSSDMLSLLLHFIPRLSLVIFTELFSLFFLRLYRSSLNEIKYYQNELTNIELKEASLLSAIHCGTPSDISNIVSTLASTERNFKLQKGESTVDLEKDKLEMNILKNIVKQFQQHFSTKN